MNVKIMTHKRKIKHRSDTLKQSMNLLGWPRQAATYKYIIYQ